MIDIERLKELAEEKYEDNVKFRTYLKNHADPEVLDEQFKQLHDKYFSIYDCSKCRNCCKQLHATFKEKEIEERAKFLNITIEEFKNKYLKEGEIKGSYKTKNCPCDFFDGNDCILKECKPEDCKTYPYTNKADRIFSLWGIVDNTAICPVVYEIVEELKKINHFR